ncbi:DUF6636 domain-containing protein [Mycolicibacterium wolinskyi]|uniref:DUF6636 domain-containing protein n=1 Tax=Mycolicibacterium wolinskyi TaxID=59750 RepID=UPI003917AC9F
MTAYIGRSLFIAVGMLAATAGYGLSSPTAGVGSAPALVNSEFTHFTSPSRNIHCAMGESSVRCDITERDWSPPPRPADCRYDYGQGISFSAGTRPDFVCAGDSAQGPGDTLAYGQAISAGPIRCESTEAGITCRDADSGHGFSLSREAYQIF